MVGNAHDVFCGEIAYEDFRNVRWLLRMTFLIFFEIKIFLELFIRKINSVFIFSVQCCRIKFYVLIII